MPEIHRGVDEISMDNERPEIGKIRKPLNAKDYGAICGNCGGRIPPNSPVSVLVGAGDERIILHSTYECSPPGGAFYGFWGEGELVSSFERIEQC